MATEEKDATPTCASDPNFAIICAFLQKFAKHLNLQQSEIHVLQEWLENVDEVPEGLKQLHIKLLRKLRKTVHETAWETALVKFCYNYSAQDAWEVERFGYKKSSLKVKLRILKELLEWQFQLNGKFRTIVDSLSSEDLRSTPLGRDRLGHGYWLTIDPKCNLRIYQEHLDEDIWQVVASNKEEVATLIKRLKGNEVVLPSIVGIVDEDSSSNSCQNIIKPPPPEEMDESQSSASQEAKVPSIKIKIDSNGSPSVKIETNDDEKNLVVKKVEKKEHNVKKNNEDINCSEEEECVGFSEDSQANKIEKEGSDGDDIKHVNENSAHNNIKNSLTPTKDEKTYFESEPIKVTSKKRPLEQDNDEECPVEPELENLSKKQRPTLLDSKCKKKISKYERYNAEFNEEEFGEEEELDSEEDDELDDEEEESPVGEEVAEDVMLVRGEGAGSECEGTFSDLQTAIMNARSNSEVVVGEEIVEELRFFVGEGFGVDCDVGNTQKSSNSEATSATVAKPPGFYFGHPGCLKLSPIKKASVEDAEGQRKEKPAHESKSEVEDKDKGVKSCNNELVEDESKNGKKTDDSRANMISEKLSPIKPAEPDTEEILENPQELKADLDKTQCTLVNRKRRLSGEHSAASSVPNQRSHSESDSSDINSDVARASDEIDDEDDVGGKRMKVRGKTFNSEVRRKGIANNSSSNNSSSASSSSDEEFIKPPASATPTLNQKNLEREEETSNIDKDLDEKIEKTKCDASSEEPIGRVTRRGQSKPLPPRSTPQKRGAGRGRKRVVALNPKEPVMAVKLNESIAQSVENLCTEDPLALPKSPKRGDPLDIAGATICPNGNMDDKQTNIAPKPTTEILAVAEDETTPLKPKTSPVKKKATRQTHDVDTSNILELESDATPVRQSRRIAQQKIKEEAERRKQEEVALKKMKAELQKKKKEESKETIRQEKQDPEFSEPEDDDSEANSEVELKRKMEKKKKGKKKHDGQWSSGTDDEEDDEEEEHESERGSPLLADLKSDHEFSPESDLEDDSQVVPMKRARTVRKEGEEDFEDPNEACEKCGKTDHPEWILLCDKCDKGYHCSCLSPVLFHIPEGDWFCPPCEQEKLILALEQHLIDLDVMIKRNEEEELEKQKNLELAEKQAQVVREEEERKIKEKEEASAARKKSKQDAKSNKRRQPRHRRQQRLSSDDDNEEEKRRSSEEDDDDDDDDSSNATGSLVNRSRRIKNLRALRSSSGSSSNSRSSNGSSSATDSDDEPIYKLRKRRQINVSYRFNEYDDLINSAIKKEMDEAAGAGNLGRGKDISTIIEADKYEKMLQKKLEAEEHTDNPVQEELEKHVAGTTESSEATDVAVETKPNVLKVELKEENSEMPDEEDSGSEIEQRKNIQKFATSAAANRKKSLKKKNRKLNSLEISSEDDGSDEDFKTSSYETDEDEEDDESVSEESDSSLEIYKRRKQKKRTTRRVVRTRRKRFDDEFIAGDSDDEEDIPLTKKKRREDSDYSASVSEVDELSEDIDSADLCDDTTSTESDGAWRPSKSKKQRTTGITAQKEPKSMPKTKKKSKVRKEEGERSFKAGFSKKKRSLDSDERKTRGKRYAYLDDYEDESSEDGIKPGVKRPDTPPEEREQFIRKQEEIKRLLAEKKAQADIEKAQTDKVKPADSLSTVPLSVIKSAKALDIDYLKHKGELQSEEEGETDFDDDLPEDFNPEDMDEEAIAKMMEEEDFAQQQLKLAGEAIRQKKSDESSPHKKSVQQISQAALQSPLLSSQLTKPQTLIPKMLSSLQPDVTQLLPATITGQHPMVGGSSAIPKGRRKKITPLRDPLQKQQAAQAAQAAATAVVSTSFPNTSNPKMIKMAHPPQAQSPQSQPFHAEKVKMQQPTNLSGTSGISVVQPPQLYKSPLSNTQPSVITRLPQVIGRPPPTSLRFGDPSVRYYPPLGNQFSHRPPPRLGGPGMPLGPGGRTLGPGYASGPPPLRPGGGARGDNHNHPPLSARSPLVGRAPNGAGGEQFVSGRSPSHTGLSHPPYRPPLFGAPGYPPAPPQQHIRTQGGGPPPTQHTGAFGPTPPPYNSYYPPTAINTHPTQVPPAPTGPTATPASVAMPLEAMTTVGVVPLSRGPVVTPVPLITTPSPAAIAKLSQPPQQRASKAMILETFNSKSTPPPLEVEPSILGPSPYNPVAVSAVDVEEGSSGGGDNDAPLPSDPLPSSSSEFSGLVSYFSSQQDDLDT